MAEPLTAVGIGAIAAYLGKDGVAKILGPTADYLGTELQEFTKKRLDNIGKIFGNAQSKLGEKTSTPGAVPPKVLKTVMNEGSYSEEQLAVEYFGGVLASSRTELARDDRGARIARTLDAMSCYQLRCHYLIYASIAHVFRGKERSFAQHTDRMKLGVYLPIEEFANGMALTKDEWDNPQLMSHIFHGLNSDGLITDQWAWGNAETLKTMIRDFDVPGPGIVCTPTAAGAELFLWGFGFGSKGLDFIFSSDFSAVVDGVPEFVTGAMSTAKT